VPEDAPTIQGGIEMAGDDDLVLVAPGTYQESVYLSGKGITLASHYLITGDSDYIEMTVIDAAGGTGIYVDASVLSETTISGFTVQNGQDGVVGHGVFTFENNRVVDNGDGLDYEAGGGLCRDNLFARNRDDGVDLDGAVAVVVEGNSIVNNGDDGIEIRLHPYEGPTLDVVIRDNAISDNGEDGIQLIDYSGLSSRVFRIERNLISRNAMAGIGLMGDENTRENYEGASIRERIAVFNNTLAANDYGLTGGDNLIALNNIFAGSTGTAVKNTDGESIVAHSLFWSNGADWENSNIDTDHAVVAAPEWRSDFRLTPGSPAIDAGISYFAWDSEVVLQLDSGDYAGAAPDLGAYEFWFDRYYLPIVLRP
jgi:hypothetical protein